VHKVENSLRVMLSYTIPAETPGGAPTCVYAGIVELCSPHTMLVNKRGLRFADETFFQGIVPELRRFDPGRHLLVAGFQADRIGPQGLGIADFGALA